jgi:hypothetical protein
MQDQLERLEESLERAAEALGDLTAPVLARFYAHHPQARAAFAHHGGDRQARLEADMVETALYCAMGWFERRAEIQIVLAGATPHHQETLAVPLAWYLGLIEALVAVIVETIPPDAAAERAVWAEIAAGLTDTIHAARSTLAA